MTEKENLAYNGSQQKHSRTRTRASHKDHTDERSRCANENQEAFPSTRYAHARALARSRRVARAGRPHPGDLLRQPPGVCGTAANSLCRDGLRFVPATLSWASRGAQRDRPVSRRLRSIYSRAHACLGRSVSGDQYADHLAQTRRPHGAARCAPARDVWPDHRDECRVSESLPLAGAERMPDHSHILLVRARLPPVSQWAVRASVDALDFSRISCMARPYGFRCASHAEYTGCRAYLSRVSRRIGDGCTHPTLPLPAGVQPPGAPADQMGGLRSRRAGHGRCSRVCVVSAVPSAIFTRFTLSVG